MADVLSTLIELVNEAAGNEEWDARQPEPYRLKTCPYVDEVELPEWAWPGGYQIVYYTQLGDDLCNRCATESWSDLEGEAEYTIEGDDPATSHYIHEEGPETECAACGHVMPSDHGDPDAEDQDADQRRQQERWANCPCKSCAPFLAMRRKGLKAGR